jgi:hypothetical protein
MAPKHGISVIENIRFKFSEEQVCWSVEIATWQKTNFGGISG